MGIRDLIGYLVVGAMFVYGVVHKIEVGSWTETQATVDKVVISETSRNESSITSSRRTYDLYVYYTFQAGDVQYSGYGLGANVSTRASAERRRSIFTSERVVAVRYDPNDPENSELK